MELFVTPGGILFVSLLIDMQVVQLQMPPIKLLREEFFEIFFYFL
jgi:hypothetical protein